ncbi:MAG: T9SS type A sorting domain-containing protein [Saprospiraceae bacterium]|nr:T9SS type A sorting domain-containing protein [Saprospiraceae bacterium]
MKFFPLFVLLIMFSVVHGQMNLHFIEQNSVEIGIDSTFGKLQSLECIIDSIKVDYDAENNNINLSNLKPSTVFTLCATFEKNGLIEIFEKTIITKSSSSGDIKVYFNNPIDTSFRKSDYKPHGTQFGELQIVLREVIRNAKTTIDFAAYNTNELFVVNELIDAHNRGVRVRVITDDETSNTGWNSGVPFPIVRGNLGSGLMHNKFLIIDKDSELNSLVITGSMNFTSNQMRSDPNHLIFIQDKSLAIGYTIEFDEMWGSNTILPNLGNARFGANKIQNTPVNYMIGSVPVELYFSPSDKTTSKIIDQLKKTKENILLGLMIFTNWELRDQVVKSLQSNVPVRWIVDDDSNSAGVMQAVTLNKGEVKVHSHPDLFHHKYAILDDSGSNPVLITGSHNWTFSAETINDENTLVFYDQRMTNIFRQEFEARWKELNLTSQDEIRTGKNMLIYPNPSEGMLYVDRSIVKIEIFNLLGQKLKEINNPVSQIFFELANGIYIFILHTENGTFLNKVMKL